MTGGWQVAVVGDAGMRTQVAATQGTPYIQCWDPAGGIHWNPKKRHRLVSGYLSDLSGTYPYASTLGSGHGSARIRR